MKPKCKSLLLNTCANCTKIAIDDYSYLHSGTMGTDEKGDFWHAVPFPSNFHWSKYTPRPFPWERDIDSSSRTTLVSYVGSTQSYYNPARRLRGSLVHFCSLHAHMTVHITYGGGGGRSVFRDPSSTRNPLDISSRSIFCFQPIGDLMTRKGLFDSLLQGCIPVTFDDLTAAVMYTWHWSEEFWREISVMLHFHGVTHRYIDPVEELKKTIRNNSSLIKKNKSSFVAGCSSCTMLLISIMKRYSAKSLWIHGMVQLVAERCRRATRARCLRRDYGPCPRLA